ncbi:hypothetical protein E7V67_012155 [[Empedobacter] haloabium]|uniref:HNH nuclease domain-containing protein n=1 Tax=[Empedobacter] haloabium TaxID=592317 RepID=A0ABZ1USV6_9BURK
MIPVAHEADPPATLKVFHEKTVRRKGGVRLTRAASETERAIAHFTNAAHYAGNKKVSKENFVFRIYSEKEVSDYLDGKFNKKCGYCESAMAHVTPKDIDHYRPKASIEGAGYAYHPGYYWLGANWHNLVVACPRCNRSAGHEVPGVNDIQQLGKASQFPLLREGVRVRSHTGVLDDEEQARLLLHPYFDQPGDHLEFGEDGLVRPRIQPDGRPSEKGLHSIEVYALQRAALVEQRKKTLDDFDFLVRDAAHLIAMHAHVRNARARRSNEAQLQLVFVKMAGFFGAKAPYQAMLRQYLERHRGSRRFAALRRAGLDLMDLLAA